MTINKRKQTMTINKKRLKKIIKEEIKRTLHEESQPSVYVLWDILGGYDDSIFGIYSSPERAEAAKNAGQSEGKTTKFRIERLLLDPPTK